MLNDVMFVVLQAMLIPLLRSHSGEPLRSRLTQTFLSMTEAAGLTPTVPPLPLVDQADQVETLVDILKSGLSAVLSVASRDLKHVLLDDVIMLALDAADVNGDGVLSYSEFVELFPK